MAVPTYEISPTLITSAETETNWTGTGQNSGKWAQEEDFVYEGTFSNGLAPSQTGVGVFGYDAVGGVDLSASTIQMWVYVGEQSFLTDSTDTVRIRVCSSASWTTDYREWAIASSDRTNGVITGWLGSGWHLVALDVSDTTGSTQTGTFVNTSVDRIGLYLDVAKIARKSTIFAIDKISYIANANGLTVTSPFSSSASHSFTTGTNTITRAAGSFTTDGFEVGDTIDIDGTVSNDGEYTLATVGTTTMTTNESLTTESTVTSTIRAYITLPDLIADDVANDTAYGAVTYNRDNQIEVNYKITFGDNSGTNIGYFLSRNEVITLADQPTGVTLAAVEDTGTTRFQMGDSSGTGDSRVGFSGSTITIDGDYHNRSRSFDFSVGGATDIRIFGTSFIEMAGGVDFGTTTTHYVTNTSFVNCGQIDLGSVEARGLTFAGYTLDTNGALLWNGSINIKNSQFLANTDATNDPHAIEHPAQGTFTYDNLLFAGNDYDIYYTAAASSGLLTINNTNGSNASTYEILNTTGNTVSIVTAVTLTITVIDQDGDPIENAQTAIYRTSDDLQLMNEDTTALGIATESYSGTNPAAVYIRVRKSSVGDTRYVPNSAVGTIDTSGLSATITMRTEPLA